jgi:hypothetical protein
MITVRFYVWENKFYAVVGEVLVLKVLFLTSIPSPYRWDPGQLKLSLLNQPCSRIGSAGTYSHRSLLEKMGLSWKPAPKVSQKARSRSDTHNFCAGLIRNQQMTGCEEKKEDHFSYHRLPTAAQSHKVDETDRRRKTTGSSQQVDHLRHRKDTRNED